MITIKKRQRINLIATLNLIYINIISIQWKHNLCINSPDPSVDHPVHPPGRDNPWKVDLLPDCGYKIKAVDGVFQVMISSYRNRCANVLNNTQLRIEF